MKGIVLSGGLGKRLRPLTNVISKQALPVYDKPMIYYPLSVLIRAGIYDIAIISDEKSLPLFRSLLGDGSSFGVRFEYIVQKTPNGIAQAFVLAEKFLDGDSSCLVLGDNIFHGAESFITESILSTKNCTVFGYRVKDPTSYGVAVFDDNGRLIRVEEKPKVPPSNISIPGLYVFDSTAPERAMSLKPSSRNEYEITDLINSYIEDGSASNICILPDGVAWLDMGTVDGLLQASLYVQTIQQRQGIQISCLEVDAFNRSLLSLEELKSAYHKHSDTEYGFFIKKIIDNVQKA